MWWMIGGCSAVVHWRRKRYWCLKESTVIFNIQSGMAQCDNIICSKVQCPLKRKIAPLFHDQVWDAVEGMKVTVVSDHHISQQPQRYFLSTTQWSGDAQWWKQETMPKFIGKGKGVLSDKLQLTIAKTINKSRKKPFIEDQNCCNRLRKKIVEEHKNVSVVSVWWDRGCVNYPCCSEMMIIQISFSLNVICNPLNLFLSGKYITEKLSQLLL